MKNCSKFYTVLFIFFWTPIQGQQVPIPMDHPVNDLILRLITQKKIQNIQHGSRPFSVHQVERILSEVSNDKDLLDKKELALVHRFLNEFRTDSFKEGLEGPWNKSQIVSTFKRLVRSYNPDTPETRFISYDDEEITLWTDWEESFSVDMNDSVSRSFFRDRVTIAGHFAEKLSFYSRYTLYRMHFNENDPYPDEYKQGYTLLEENTDWLVWDVSEASLFWENDVMNLELSKIPIYWGFSKKHSPILSSNVQSFAFFRVSKTFKKIRAQSMMGSLTPFSNGDISINKFIAAHRFEFDLTQDLTISFSEMVLYADRDIELGYLLPVNLFWSEEHSLGNKDNVLMSFDAFWRVKPKLSVYGTFFWDELAWFKLFKPWWGNKFIFQTGVYWIPFKNLQLPDFRFEYTASRPWVYTHQDSLLNYTSAEHGLGFPLGPNSQLFYLEMNMWPSSKMFLSFNIINLKKGTELGSSVNDNYTLRNTDLDDNTSMLLGEISESISIGVDLNYRLTQLIYLQGKCNYNVDTEILMGRVGILINY